MCGGDNQLFLTKTHANALNAKPLLLPRRTELNCILDKLQTVWILIIFHFSIEIQRLIMLLFRFFIELIYSQRLYNCTNKSVRFDYYFEYSITISQSFLVDIISFTSVNLSLAQAVGRLPFQLKILLIAMSTHNCIIKLKKNQINSRIHFVCTSLFQLLFATYFAKLLHYVGKMNSFC